ncbi:hypothetical protein ACFW9M_03230 [Streptomyces lydicus]|uniref:baeRF2 domain-containing protein n=1 Tax=Streptomyces lydicus TaxID=47763 RepID=UPI0036B81B21
MDDVVGGAPDLPGPQGEALFVSGGRLLGAFTLVEPPAADSAQVLPVPDPLGVAIDRDHQLPHVVVAVDREGADVEAYPAAAHEPASRRTFNGSTLRISRVRAGAEAMGSYHRRTVNLWTENTEQAADDVRAAVASVEAAVVLVAGDPKAVGLLREHLAARQSDAEVVYIEGGRTDDSPGRPYGQAWTPPCTKSWPAVTAPCWSVWRRSWPAAGRSRAFQRSRRHWPRAGWSRCCWPPTAARTRSCSPPAVTHVPWAPTQRRWGEDSTAFSASAAPLLLRSAVLGGASFTEILPPTRCTDGVAALPRY